MKVSPVQKIAEPVECSVQGALFCIFIFISLN